MEKSKLSPNLQNVLDNFKEDMLSTVNCVQIGTVEEFDSDTQTVTVRLSIKQVKEVDSSGSKELVEHPLLLEVPVVILTGGTAHLTFPIEDGDGCLIFFNDRDIDNWFVDGGVNAPNTYRKHDVSDAFALVGVRNMQDLITDYLVDGVRLKLNDNDLIQIRPANIMIKTLTSSINLLLNAINSVATLWTHTGSMIITSGLAVYGTVTGQGSNPLTISADISHTGDITTTGETRGGTVVADNGWSGTFATGDSRTVTVVSGIITNVA